MTPPTQTSIGTTGAAPASWASALDAARREGPRIATWALPFVLVVYLGLRGGGYDAIVRGEVGVAIWWVVLLGATIGTLPVTGQLRAGWIGFGLIAAFAAWTGFGIAWSPNAEASATEFARVATYLGVFVLVLSSRRPGDMRTLINGLASGMALIGILALLSRLHPAWFPTTETFPQTRNRLSYPIGYWNGLATLMAMAIPLLLFMAIQGRTVLGRAAAAASLPAVALTAFLTLSRGGALEIVVALVIFLALAPRRLGVLPGLANAAVGSAILIVGAAQRDPLNQALGTATAHEQGNEMLAMAIVVCGGALLVALLWNAPGALGVSAVDQYQEGIPTAGGHKPSVDAARGGSSSTISPATQAQLKKTKKGSAAAKLAQDTAPSRSGADGSDGSDDGGGVGLILPLILGAALLGSLAIFVVHRRRGATSA